MSNAHNAQIDPKLALCYVINQGIIRSSVRYKRYSIRRVLGFGNMIRGAQELRADWKALLGSIGGEPA